jgi:hypothetical protein
MYEEIGITQVSATTCISMSRHPQTCILHFVNQWGMIIGIVEIMISCMEGRETYTRFKVKYNKRETLYSTTLRGDEISLLVVAREDKDKEEVWAKAKDK